MEPQNPVVLTACDISTIANKVIQALGKVDNSQAPAAATYLGQMIAHDIIPATNPNDIDRPLKDVSPFLNLDSIYGSTKQYLLDHNMIKSNGHFRIRVDKDFPKPYGHDYCRNEVSVAQGKTEFRANIPEQRNDENIIISQFTVFWMRLHNKLLQDKYAKHFTEAKELIIKTFQLMTIEYVLGNVCQKDVFDYYFKAQNSIPFLINVKTGIPIFFSHATFRFGHSMVRNEYTLSEVVDPPRGTPNFRSFKTKALFNKHSKIKTEQFIDFTFFFKYEISPAASKQTISQKIDTKLANGMGSIGQQEPMIVNIVKRNLQASQQKCLKTGKSFHECFKSLFDSHIPNGGLGSILTNEQLCKTKIPSSYFDVLPLWLYILAEAEINEAGNSLGRLGSVLNIEVLRSAISQSEISVFDNGQYDFDQVIGSMGSWGDKLLSCSLSRESAKSTLMDTLFSALTDAKAVRV